MTMPAQYIIRNSKAEEVGEAAGYEGMKTLLQLKFRPDGVFCYNDLMAIGAMQATLEAGLAIPGDIAFVGCGNVRYSDYLRVPLSSIDQSTSLLGKHAGELVLDLIQQKSSTPKKVRLEPTLIIRASSGHA